MGKKTAGTINLAVTREIVTVIPSSGIFSIDMFSDDISATTTFTIELSVGGTVYDVAQESGSDISDTLVVDEGKYVAITGKPGDKIKVNFAGATTGSVSYNYNAV